MSPRSLARTIAVNRVLIGAGLLVAPRAVGRRWIGDVAERDDVTVFARALGVRDLVCGLIALHTVDHPQVGPRWQRTLAACDLVDLVATVAARRALPPSAVVGTVAIAGASAAAELWAADRL